MKTNAVRIKLQWIPAHDGRPAGDKADKLAKEATERDLEKIKDTLISVALKRTNNFQPQRSRPTRILIDTALPGKHTRSLYDDLSAKQAATLCQLRTSKNRLNSYLQGIGVSETDLCECPSHPSKTVRHFLFECSRWSQHRGRLREVAGDRWDDLAFFLGGRTEQTNVKGKLLDGERKSWEPNTEVVKRTIEFAMATGRLHNRTLDASYTHLQSGNTIS
jgi:hypothetical protein